MSIKIDIRSGTGGGRGAKEEPRGGGQGDQLPPILYHTTKMVALEAKPSESNDLVIIMPLQIGGFS